MAPWDGSLVATNSSQIPHGPEWEGSGRSSLWYRLEQVKRKAQPFNPVFAEYVRKQECAAKGTRPTPVPPPASAPAVTSMQAAPTREKSDKEVWRESTAGVRPLAGRNKVAIPPPRKVAPRKDPDVRHRCVPDFISGQATTFDETTFWLLQEGGIAPTDELDLHGMTRVQASASVERFIRLAREKGLRCVRVITGQGHHSANQEPVLKRDLKAWLDDALGRDVLAYTSAHVKDGGAGSVYVLLRPGRR